MEKLGIEFTGMRFSRADSKIDSFNPIIADIQWVFLPMVISDGQATLILSGG